MYCRIHSRLFLPQQRKWITITLDVFTSPTTRLLEGACDACCRAAKESLKQRFPELYVHATQMGRHQRSNVETAFSMIKATFGDAVRSKSDIGQRNEVLCQVLCQVLCVLIQAIHELGIEPRFQSVQVKEIL